MTKEFKYRPPIKYLFVGLGGFMLSYFFGIAIFKVSQIWFSITVGIFCLMGLVLGIVFLTLFFSKFKRDNLKIGDDFIEIPSRWKHTVRLNFRDILYIVEIDTYDNVIEIESKHGIHLIEKKWMKQKEFDLVKSRLQKFLDK